MKDKQIKECIICGKNIEYFELECDKLFTAPGDLRFKALTIWGAIGVEKEIICQNNEFVHFKFLSDNSERLVKMLGFNQDEYYQKQEEIYQTREQCNHKDCQSEGFPCFSIWEPDTPIGYFCEDHMRSEGCCPGCHQLMAGFESFDFSKSGYCENCEEAIKEDLGEYDDEYEYDEYEDFDIFCKDYGIE